MKQGNWMGVSGAGNRSDNSTRWPDRYSRGKGGYSGAPVRRQTWLLSLLALMGVALLVLGIVGGRAIVYHDKSEASFVSRMLVESREARELAYNLSGSADSTSATDLGKIRACVKAVQAINEVRSNITNEEYLVGTRQLTEITATIDEYMKNLIPGGNAMHYRETLKGQLDALYAQLESLR